jgi:hypothetical protein
MHDKGTSTRAKASREESAKSSWSRGACQERRTVCDILGMGTLNE